MSRLAIVLLFIISGAGVAHGLTYQAGFWLEFHVVGKFEVYRGSTVKTSAGYEIKLDSRSMGWLKTYKGVVAKTPAVKIRTPTGRVITIKPDGIEDSACGKWEQVLQQQRFSSDTGRILLKLPDNTTIESNLVLADGTSLGEPDSVKKGLIVQADKAGKFWVDKTGDRKLTEACHQLALR